MFSAFKCFWLIFQLDFRLPFLQLIVSIYLGIFILELLFRSYSCLTLSNWLVFHYAIFKNSQEFFNLIHKVIGTLWWFSFRRLLFNNLLFLCVFSSFLFIFFSSFRTFFVLFIFFLFLKHLLLSQARGI